MDLKQQDSPLSKWGSKSEKCSNIAHVQDVPESCMYRVYVLKMNRVRNFREKKFKIK